MRWGNWGGGGAKEELEELRGQYQKVLQDAKNHTRGLRDKTEVTERIKVR